MYIIHLVTEPIMQNISGRNTQLQKCYNVAICLPAVSHCTIMLFRCFALLCCGIIRSLQCVKKNKVSQIVNLCAAELSASIFHLFKAGIANAISSLK